jgi:hypothetical protein
MRWWYTALADWLIAHPEGSYKEAGAALGRSPVTIGLIARSDLFKAYLSNRQARISESLDTSISIKNSRVADKALDLVLEKLDEDAAKINLQTANEIAGAALTRLGYGASGAAVNLSVANNGGGNTYVAVSPEVLSEAQARIRAGEHKRLERSADHVAAPPAPAAALPTHKTLDLSSSAAPASEDRE